MWSLLLSAAIKATERPCDIYAAGGTPCVAAHSVVRSLYAAYTGKPLYTLSRASLIFAEFAWRLDLARAALGVLRHPRRRSS